MSPHFLLEGTVATPQSLFSQRYLIYDHVSALFEVMNFDP